MRNLIEQFIFETLKSEAETEEAHLPPREDQLLGEPDMSPEPDDNKQKASNEVSTAGGGGGRGVMTPVGTTSTYPNKQKDEDKKPAWEAASSGYGRAKPHKFELNALSK